jgi:hypothetical protein
VATRSPAPPTPSSLTAIQNRRHLLVSLYAVLSMDPREIPSIQSARTIVLGAMKPS